MRSDTDPAPGQPTDPSGQPLRNPLKRYALAGAGIGVVVVFLVRNVLGLPDVVSPVTLSLTLGGAVFTFGLQDILFGACLGLLAGVFLGRQSREQEKEANLFGRPVVHRAIAPRLCRLVGLMVFLAAFLGGVVAMREGMRSAWLGWRSLQWPTAAGVVSESSVTFTRTEETFQTQGTRPDHVEKRTKETWFPVVKYGYEVNGQAMTGTRIKIVDIGSSRDDAVAVAAKYPVGSGVVVSYDPLDASQAVIDPGVSAGSVAAICIGVLWCLCCAAATWFLAMSRFAKQMFEVLLSPPGTRVYDRDGALVEERSRETRK